MILESRSPEGHSSGDWQFRKVHIPKCPTQALLPQIDLIVFIYFICAQIMGPPPPPLCGFGSERGGPMGGPGGRGERGGALPAGSRPASLSGPRGGCCRARWRGRCCALCGARAAPGCAAAGTAGCLRGCAGCEPRPGGCWRRCNCTGRRASAV